MVPYLQRGEYGPGLVEGEQQIANVIAADANVTLAPVTQPVRQPAPQRGRKDWLGIIVFSIIIFFIFRGGRRGGGGWLPWFIIGNMMGGGRRGGWGGGDGGGGGGGGGGDFGGGFGGGSGKGARAIHVWPGRVEVDLRLLHFKRCGNRLRLFIAKGFFDAGQARVAGLVSGFELRETLLQFRVLRPQQFGLFREFLRRRDVQHRDGLVVHVVEIPSLRARRRMSFRTARSRAA